jgi:hypothetical protein
MIARRGGDVRTPDAYLRRVCPVARTDLRLCHVDEFAVRFRKLHASGRERSSGTRGLEWSIMGYWRAWRRCQK